MVNTLKNQSNNPSGKEPLTPYLIGLMALLCVATFCEGYDFFIISLVLDMLSKEFDVQLKSVILTLAPINVGAVLGFFVIRMGDRIGRKPILMLGLTGFSVLSVLTALSPGMHHFLVVQFLAKMFLVTQFGIAIVMVIEEFPSHIRATCVALLEVAGAVGGGFAMLVSKYVLPAWGWRGMYWLGGIPLVLLPIMYFYIRETGHFIKLRSGEAGRQPSLWHIWTTPSRKFVLPVGAIWFLCYLSYAGVIYFWVVFAKTERGWTVDQVGPMMALAALVGMSGYLVSGVMMDMIGRRVTGIIFFLASAASLVWAFTAHGNLMIPSVVASMFFIFAILPITSTFNAELFPTELRSNATAWCNSLLGRPAQVAAPFMVYFLMDIVGGIGNAVCYLAIGPFIAAIVVWKLLPETKGINLDDVK